MNLIDLQLTGQYSIVATWTFKILHSGAATLVYLSYSHAGLKRQRATFKHKNTSDLNVKNVCCMSSYGETLPSNHQNMKSFQIHDG